MRNFKKLSAIVIVLALVLSSLVPAFAAYNPVNGTKAENLNKLEIYKGISESTFDPGLSMNLTRGQGALLLSRMFGMEAAAAALTDAQATEILKVFEDAQDVPSYAKATMAYFVQQGVMTGAADTKTGKKYIKANESLFGAQFATLLLRKLGYSVSDYTVAISQLSEVNGATGVANYASLAKSALLRDDAVGIMYGILTAQYEGAKDTVVSKMVETKPQLKTVAQGLGLIEAPKVLAVDSVKALNLKQVEIDFNMAVDKTTAEKIDNYNVYNANSTTDLATSGSVALQADGKSVIITLGSQFNNGTIAKVVVKNLLAYTNSAVTVVDTAIPTVVGVAVTGPRTITVEYSEPIKNIANAEYTVDDGNYIVTNAQANGSNKVDVTVGVNFTNGEHKVKVNGTNVADYADYKVISRTINFTVAADTTAPTVSVKSVSPSEVKLTFSKPVTNVKDANVLYRHTFNSSIYEIAGTGTVTIDSSTQITIDWTAKPIPLGANKLYISYSSDTGNKIQDLWGNKLEATSVDLTVAMDTVKPAVSEVKFIDASTLKVIFNKKVEAASAQTPGNYVIKDSTGKVIAISTPSLAGTDLNEVTLTTATANALGGGNYTIEIKNVKDRALVQNIMDTYTAPLTIKDTVRPELATAKSLIDNSGSIKKATVYVPFNEVMDTTTLVKANFLKVVNGSPAAILGDDDTLTVAPDAKSVTIAIDNGTSTVSSIGVIVGAVKDAAGNGLASFSATVTPDVDSIAATTAEAISVNQIKVTYNGRLSAVSAAGYTLTANSTNSGIALSVASHTINADGNSEVIFNLGTDLTQDAYKGGYAVTLDVNNATATGTKSFLGTVVSTGSIAVHDKIVPTVYSTTVTGGAIEIVFNETIEADTLAATLNGFSVSGGDAKLTGVAMAGGAGNDGTKIVLTGTGFLANQTVVTYNSLAGIADTSFNKVADFTQTAK